MGLVIQLPTKAATPPYIRLSDWAASELMDGPDWVRDKIHEVVHEAAELAAARPNSEVLAAETLAAFYFEARLLRDITLDICEHFISPSRRKTLEANWGLTMGVELGERTDDHTQGGRN